MPSVVGMPHTYEKKLILGFQIRHHFMCEPPSSDSECLFSQDDRSTLDSHFIPSAQSSSDDEYSTGDQSLRDMMEVDENPTAGYTFGGEVQWFF